jgi:hypothetical protein
MIHLDKQVFSCRNMCHVEPDPLQAAEFLDQLIGDKRDALGLARVSHKSLLNAEMLVRNAD